MKYLVTILFFALCGVSYGQSVTGSKTRTPGVWLSSKDTATNRTSADSIQIIANRGDSSLRFYWSVGAPSRRIAFYNDILPFNDSLARKVALQTSTLYRQTGKIWVSDSINTDGVVKSSQILVGDAAPPSGLLGLNFVLSMSGTASIMYNATSNGYESSYGSYTGHPINGSSLGGKMGVWGMHYGRLSPTTGSYFGEMHATKYTGGVPNDYTFFKFMPGDGAVFFPSGHNYGDTLDFPGDTLINIKGGLRVEKSAKFTEFTGYVSNVSSSYTSRSFTDKVYVDSSISAKNINSGTYTPTLTNGANVSSSSAGLCHYVRISNEVQVQGIVTVTPTSAGGTVTEVELSLPVSSNFTVISDGWGNGNTDQTSGSNVVAYASSANDRIVVRFRAQAASTTDLYFSFTYTVK